MAALDATQWRRAGYIPAGDAARALGVAPAVIHRHMDNEEIPFKRQGRYRFIRVSDLVQWIRGQYTDRQVADGIVRRVRDAARIRREA